MVPCQSALPLRTVIRIELPTSFSNQSEQFQHFNVIACAPDTSALMQLCKRSFPCTVIADQNFILSLPSWLRQELHEQGDQVRLLAVYSSGTCRFSELLHQG